jgi:hypothetical protein
LLTGICEPANSFGTGVWCVWLSGCVAVDLPACLSFVLDLVSLADLQLVVVAELKPSNFAKRNIHIYSLGVRLTARHWNFGSWLVGVFHSVKLPPPDCTPLEPWFLAGRRLCILAQLGRSLTARHWNLGSWLVGFVSGRSPDCTPLELRFLAGRVRTFSLLGSRLLTVRHWD